ncbi:ATP/GTP-binding protein [Streptomyces sp. NPDC002952]|uniref:ATP/GTP-binding protein n=1 Tax=Streptomyces sp. NPDC002952 TaxID=3364673 RepID=UPI0036AE3262
MDSPASAVSSLATSWPITALHVIPEVTAWWQTYWYAVVLTLGALWVLTAVAVRKVADKVGRERMAIELIPEGHFDPDAEEIFRRGVQLVRACTSVPWWAPRSTKSVRIRLRADGKAPLLHYRIEGPAGAQQLLTTTPFGRQVKVIKARPVPEAKQKHQVRAEFVLRGRPGAPLRDVPLQPDPLQPLIDAVSSLQAQAGDLADICIDIQRAPRWAVRLRRAQMLQAARRREYGEVTRSARWSRHAAAEVEETLAGLVRGVASRRGTSQRLLMTPQPQRIDREEALGKLHDAVQLVRVQVLVRCASNHEGRAQALLAQVHAAFDVFGEKARWSMRGLQTGPVRLGADQWPWRPAFEQRFTSGQCRPPRTNWVELPELTGLLKPPTRHARVPLTAGDLPAFNLKDPSLLLQGWHLAPGGWRLAATRADETLFEVAVGKSGYGKTERALAQAVGVALSGGGLLFIDPHGDSWQRAAPYLAHPKIMKRIARIDFSNTNGNAPMGSWNPIGMQHQPLPYEVVTNTVDAFATALAWDDASAPRAVTIFTEAINALVTFNRLACAAGQPRSQATLFQVRPLLTDADFRTTLLKKIANALDADALAWWLSTFPTLPPEAFAVILNPLSRLARNPVIRGFLGHPAGAYNIRTAMDSQMVVWLCPAGNGPSDRLLLSLLARDLLRAGRSRRDMPPSQRVPFRVYLSELITLTGSSPETWASMFEDWRKFGVRAHAESQLLARLPRSVSESLLQNASTLTTTAGSTAVTGHITGEWNNQPSPEEVGALERFHHYASFTVKGRRVGPLLLRGPNLDDVFAEKSRPKRVGQLNAAADENAQAQPLSKLLAIADTQMDRIQGFLGTRAAKASESDATDDSTQGEFK